MLHAPRGHNPSVVVQNAASPSVIYATLPWMHRPAHSIKATTPAINARLAHLQEPLVSTTVDSPFSKHHPSTLALWAISGHIRISSS